MVQVNDTIIYIDFYLAGDLIFSCQKSWLPSKEDIRGKCIELAEKNMVEISLIIWVLKLVELPIILPNEILSDLNISLSQ